MQKNHLNHIEIILSAIALILLISIFLKAIFDVDTNYDVGWYHLPFAARIWGIIPAELFTAGAKVESRYDGFPLLAHFFQGLLWKITGRVQATNLVGYFSIIIYLFFLRSFFKVPLYLSATAILAIPAVLTHAPTSFVDLPGNIGASVLTMMSYKLFLLKRLPNTKELLITFLGAVVAGNTKPQLQPLVFVIYCTIGIRLAWLYFEYTISAKRRRWLIGFLTVIASTLIFITPIKNIVLYRNPFYPTKIAIAGFVLNHKAVPETYNEGNRPQKWLRSVLEINTPEWSADQFNRDGNVKLLDRGGGFFGAYVIFNFILLLVLSIRENFIQIAQKNNKSATIALISILLVSLVPANFPQSHELRYFMFWMISLVSINLSILAGLSIQSKNWLNVRIIYLTYAFFLIIVCIKIKSFYLRPDFRSLQDFLSQNINTEYLSQISPNTKNCLISGFNTSNSISVQYAFFYNSYFYPQVTSSYSIYVKENVNECGKDNIVPVQP